MGVADKIKSSKDNRVKVKRIRFGNIKDFHGRRQHGENTLIQEESKKHSTSSNTLSIKCFHRDPVSPCPIFFPPPQKSQKITFLPKLIDETKKINRPSFLSETNSFSFDVHMAQWAEDLRKPLVTPSSNVEFDMPYCYSKGLYTKVLTESFLEQPFNSVGEEPPLELWSPNTDSLYEKAQLALQYYRYLCEQPSRMPLQTITIKRTIAQLAAEQCALLGPGLYFEMFHNSGVRIGNVMFEEKNKSTLYLVPDHVNAIKPPEYSGIQDKSDSSIFTSSWQN